MLPFFVFLASATVAVEMARTKDIRDQCEKLVACGPIPYTRTYMYRQLAAFVFQFHNSIYQYLANYFAHKLDMS